MYDLGLAPDLSSVSCCTTYHVWPQLVFRQCLILVSYLCMTPAWFMDNGSSSYCCIVSTTYTQSAMVPPGVSLRLLSTDWTLSLLTNSTGGYQPTGSPTPMLLFALHTCLNTQGYLAESCKQSPLVTAASNHVCDSCPFIIAAPCNYHKTFTGFFQWQRYIVWANWTPVDIGVRSLLH